MLDLNKQFNIRKIILREWYWVYWHVFTIELNAYHQITITLWRDEDKKPIIIVDKLAYDIQEWDYEIISTFCYYSISINWIKVHAKDFTSLSNFKP